jgi:cobalt-zinc-cadmium efflux system protein
MLLTVAVFAIECVGGIASRSLALLADATHVFADLAALILAYAAMTMADRAPTRRLTFGLYRAEILAAFVNAQVLLVLSLGILVEAAIRLRSPVEVQPRLMLVVAAVALGANLVAIRLLSHGHEHRENLNLRAAYLEVLGDAMGSAAVLVIAVAIPATGWGWLDPAVSAAVALVILRQSAHILLEGAPGDIDLPALRTAILGVPGVETIHDLHFWTLTSGIHSGSLHIRAAADAARADVLAQVQRVLHEAAGIDHATIQLEMGDEMTCHAANRGHA